MSGIPDGALLNDRWGEIADGLGLLVVLGFLMLCNCF